MKKFEENFLDELMKCCLSKKSVFLLVRKYLEDNYLPENEYRDIWSEIKTYYNRYERAPTLGILRQRFTGQDEALDFISRIQDIVKPNYEGVIREFELFIKQSKFLHSYDEIANLYMKDKEQAYSFFTKAADELYNFSLKGASFDRIFSDFERRQIERIFDRSNPSRIDTIIPTGIDLLDYYMNGGTQRGEATLLLGDSGSGKSQMLIHLAIAAARRNFKVVHFQAEGTKKQTLDRYDAAWSGILYKEMKKGEIPSGKFKALKQIAKKLGRNDIYVECRERYGAWSMNDIRQSAHELNKSLGGIDLIVIDYLELIEPGDGRKYGAFEERFRQTATARLMKDLAVELDASLITPTQASVIAPEAKENPDFKLTRWNLSEDKGKIRPFDNFITINQTDDERTEQMVRLYTDKLREHASGQIIRIAQKLSRARFYDRVRTVEEIYTQDEIDLIGA